MIEERFLREFSYLKDTVYLDTASLGMQPERTRKFCRNFQDEFVESLGRVCLGPYEARREKVRGDIASLIHADADEIMFTMNAGEGNGLLPSCLKLQPGDSVITADIEYPSVSDGWIRRQAEGIEVRFVPAKNGVIRAQDVIALMDDTTKAVSLSWVQYRSGYKLDAEAVGRACRSKGILFAVDATQGLGRNPMDVQSMYIDLLSCSGFKGLMGVLGAGFVYVRRELKPLLARKMEEGSLNTYGILAMGCSLELLQEIGIDRIWEHIHGLETYYREALQKAALPVTIRGSRDPAAWSGNVSIVFDVSRQEALESALKEAGICIHLRPGDMRIGLHFFNTKEHIDRLMAVLKKVLV